MTSKPILILCLGNEVLCDDAFGPTVAKLIDNAQQTCDRVEVIFAPLAGFRLLDLLRGREKVLIVDSIVTENCRPGTLHFFPMGNLTPSRGLTTSHQMSLPTALDLGRKLGYLMPEHIDVLAVEIADNTTLSETMTEAVAAAVPVAVGHIEHWLGTHTLEVADVNRTPVAAVT